MDVVFELFNNYGWWSIVGVGILGCMFLLFKYLGTKITGDVTDGMEKIADKMTKSISDQNKELVKGLNETNGKLIDYIVKGKTDNQEEHDGMLTERMELAEEINLKLKDIMYIHNAERAFIIEFHNSYQNRSGIPFAKYSCTYEWFAKGLTPFSNRCLGLPFSTMARIVKDVMSKEEKQIIYTDLAKLEEENPTLFSMLADEERRTTAVCYTCMFDNKNTLIGMLVLEWQKHWTSEEFSRINMNELRLESAELTSILNLRYKYQK